MPYRIELAKTGRAGCKDSVCKTEARKINKGELRLGVWVEIPDRGASWQWRHWGCVSGEQIKNLREYTDDEHGGYDWDKIDGWEDLDNEPETRATIQRVLKQGHIDPEDFNGDPEFNKPGQKGIRPRNFKRKKADINDGETDEAPTPAPKAKGGRKKVKSEDDASDSEPPAKKTKTKKSGAMVKDEPSDAEAAPLKKAPVPRGKRGSKKATAVKDESDVGEEPEPPKKAKRGAKKAVATKDENDVDAELAAVPPKKTTAPKPQRGARKAAVKVKDEIDEDDEAEPEPQPPKKKAVARGKRGAAKKAPTPEDSEPEPGADEEPEDDEKPEKTVVTKRRGRSSNVSAAAFNGDAEAETTAKPAPKKRGRKAKS